MDAASRWRAPTGSGAARLLAAGCVIACCAAASRQHTYLNYTGDIILGALFPVHGRGRGGVECGRIQKEVGMQPLEAMLYTLQQINNSSELLPGIKLGMLAFDTCDSATYGLEQSLSFAKAFIAHQNEFHAQEFACSDGSAPRFRAGGLDKVVAVVGAQSSSVTVQVATMLQLFKVPQVSYMATSPALSNKERFPYFFRTVPSDINRAHAMLEILGKFNWTYVSVVYSDDAYGTHGFKILSELAVNYSICFSSQHRIESEATNQHEIVLREMKRKANLKVVVVFADKKTMQNLLTTANRLGLKNRFLWIVSDIWVANEKVRSSTESSPYTEMPNYEYESVLEGALAIQPLVAELKGFDSYFRSLNFDHRIENPWFEEYWMEYFNCSKKFKDVEPAEANETADKSAGRCGAAAGFSLGAGPYRQQHYLHFVRDAVHAVARALDAMRRRLCGAEPGLCRAMAHIDGEQLRDYLRDVSFLDDEGNQFEFLEGGDGPPRYSILNFQKSSDGNFYWRVVGNYTQTGSSDPVLIINEESVVHQNNGTLPIFTCNQPCADNQIKVLEVEERCCWTCRRCGEFEFRSDDYTCDTCPLGTRPGGDRSHCVDIPEQFVDGGSPWALAALCLAGAGVVLTALVAGVYRAHAETPVIKASGRELSYLLLCGILASFCATFAIAARPSGAACALARFLVGFSPALCYSAAVTRTNRVARIFAQQRARAVYKLRYTSPRSQLVITGLLTLVEVVILASWLIFIPPRAGHIHPDRGARVLICEGFRNHSCLVALLYPFVLIAICTVYAFKTRKCPDGFNETKHIAFTNYTTIIIWLAFVPFYLASTSNGIRITSLAFSSSVSGLVQLACLFFPKLYIVLLKPQKNTRDGVMANHRSVICLPEPRVSGCSCSHQGSSSKNSDLNNSSCTQDNKIQRESTVGNKVQCLHQSRTERIGSEQPKEVKILATEGIQDGEV
ncbi:metabotropic glutamate receptor 3-like [Bacillus rossius redtenbacheri]|uniref:metabotropic glutamate receptor 3-like n=1 Tax=Bacillus rossius redtenbacheri TaxID=93214 RepID=UPI002FDD74F0